MASTELKGTAFFNETGPIENELSGAIRSIAIAIIEDAANVKPGQRVLLWYDEPGQQLVEQLYLGCFEKGADVRVFRRDYEGDAGLLPSLDEAGVRSMFDVEAALMDWAENVLIVRNPANPEAMMSVSAEQQRLYQSRYAEVHHGRSDGSLEWTLFLWPTEYEAEKEGLDHETYFREVIEACNQPWAEIKAAQRVLKEKLDSGTMFELIANENDPDPNRRTHVTMSIDGMTFCNSTIDHNYPGSEVFSAPVMTSVNGQIFAPGAYEYAGNLMEDLLFVVKDGKIVEAHAALGDDSLQGILAMGEGARYFGEVALGTNAGLARRFFNPLLNEKVGGSFHMAIGHCYTLTTYDGDHVNVNNGNTEDLTPVHWDVTILMHKGCGGGKVIVDGEVIQENGIFVDPTLAILNPHI
jgi:aminopeptidase